MQRDFDLIRTILLEIEASDSDDYIYDLPIEGYSYGEICYHVTLMKEAGLIDAVLSETMGTIGTTSYFIRRLTWDGHEFLDACRDEGIWNDAKSNIESKVSSVPFDVLNTVLVSLGSKVVLAGLGC